MTSYLDAIGATVLATPAGAWQIVWPPTHAAKFGPTTTIAFDPAIAEGARAELCVVGSDILDRMIDDASVRGHHCIAQVDAMGSPPPSEVLAANLQFPNARPEVLNTARGAVPYLLFNFRVTLTTDEKAEFLRSILINAETLQEHPAADVFLQESLTVHEEAILAGHDLAAAYRAACLDLERSIRDQVESLRRRAQALLADELARIRGFYDTSIKELYRGRKQEPLTAERAFRAECDRRTDETKQRYDLVAEARLVNARTILIPTTSMRVRLENSRASKELDLEFDAVSLETNRPVCETCGTSMGTVYLCSRGHLACAACDHPCAFCDDLACTKCAAEWFSKCTACDRECCTDHSFLDETGRKPYCEDHIHACAICGRMVGPAYVRACRLCGQSYCAVDVEASGRCVTCRTLVPVPATNPDVTRVAAAKGEPRNLTRWLRGSNAKYTILIGKGAVTQYLYVLDHKGNLIRRQKRLRLAG